MQGTSSSEAQYILNYAEEYLDFLENFPNILQPHLSRIRRLDAEYLGVLHRLNEVHGEMEECSEEDEVKRRELLSRIKFLLVEGQRIGDEKLEEVAIVSQLKEARLAQLDSHRRNFVVEVPKKPENTRLIRSNVSITGPRHLNGTRVENGRSTADDKRSSDRNQSERFVESRASSVSDRPESSGTKRPRRQKQFPDFIRDVEYNGNGNGNGGGTISTKRERATPVSLPLPPAPPPAQAKMKRKRSTGKRKEAAAPGRASSRKVPVLFDTPIDPEEPLYCVCQQVSYGEMIGCDYGGCEVEWFHFSCVGLATKPKGKWFCPNCRGDKPNSLKNGL